MSHPYRLQLIKGASSDDLNVEVKYPKKSSDAKPIKVVYPNTDSTKRKSHPYLSQLPGELPKHMEKIHVKSPARSKFSTNVNLNNSPFIPYSKRHPELKSTKSEAYEPRIEFASPNAEYKLKKSYSSVVADSKNCLNGVRGSVTVDSKNNEKLRNFSPTSHRSTSSNYEEYASISQVGDKDDKYIVTPRPQAKSDVEPGNSSPSEIRQPTAARGNSAKSSTELEAFEMKIPTIPSTPDAISHKFNKLSLSSSNLIQEDKDSPLISQAKIPSVEPSIESSAKPSVEPSIEPSVGPPFEPSVEPSFDFSVEPSTSTQSLPFSITSHKEQAPTNDSTVSLLPMDVSIEMYGKNVKKIKDPNVLFSYAQVLIKSALSKNKDDSITEEKREQYIENAHVALKKASRSGCIDAQYFLGDAYSMGLFSNGKPDLNKALSYFESAGKAKHSESAYRTAICYRKGWGCTPDARKVIKFLEIASLNNHPVSMMEYGVYCFHGLMGLPEDINTKKKGISWLRRATECATDLSCGAPYELALIYMNGFKDIVIKDTNYAIKLLFKAVNLGHAKSASLLGKIYEIGDVVESNSDLSIHFYNISASLGNADGMMGLCSWYFVGTEHLAKDYDEAFAWAMRAADCGFPKAMLLLQRFYELGLGCEKDLVKARYWADESEKIQVKKS